MSKSASTVTSNEKDISADILLGVELESLELSDDLLKSTSCLSCSDNNIVQCSCVTCDGATTDYDYYSSSDMTDEEVDEHWEQIDSVDEKYSSHLKKKYLMPQRLKDKEHVDQKNENNDTQTFLSPRDPKLKFDESTIEILEKLITNRYIANYNYVISSSKDYTLIYADGSRYPCKTMPWETAVKIYRLSKDPVENEAIFKNTRKEFDHLKLLYRARIKNWIPYSPYPIKVWRNVILTSHVQSYGVVLSESSKDLDKSTYKEIISIMTVYYLKVGLVHGKLSPKKNIFIKPFRIFNWCHSVKATHPQALQLMMRDCHAITKFYENRGAKVMKTEALFKHITGTETIRNELIKKISPNKSYDSLNPNRSNNNLQPKKLRGWNRFKHAN